MKTNYEWSQKTQWGALKISATTDGVHSVRLGSRSEARRLDPDAPKKVQDIVRSFERFFAGEMRALDSIEVDLSRVDNDFQRKVLETLHRKVRPGETISYGELAEVVGHPGAARAVGTAMARNPVPIVVPCHRVLASGGGIGGYGGGLEMKRGLLRLEGALLV